MKIFIVFFFCSCFDFANVIKIEELRSKRKNRKVFLKKIKKKIVSIKDYLFSGKFHGIIAGSIGIPLVWWHAFGKPTAKKRLKNWQAERVRK